MNILKGLRGRDNGAVDPGPPETGSAGGHDLPIDRYDSLDGKKLTNQFHGLTQADLAKVEEYERSHRDRPEVLAKLRYLRQDEPLPGYDDLDSTQIAEALEGANAEKVKAVRDYERKFQRRHDVLKETARVLPGSEPSARETSAQAEKDARVASKMRPTK